MLRIKIFNTAGITVGRPNYSVLPQGALISDAFYTEQGNIRAGAYAGETLNRTAEGELSIYTAPFSGAISAYRLYITESLSSGGGQVETVQLYRETYDDPITVTPYSDFDTLLARADRYGRSGIEFEGNRYANTFAGQGGNDRLFGEGGNDVLNGRGGNDLISGGTGADRMIGGAGNDIFLVDARGDRVVEAASGGVDVVRSWVSYTLPDAVENLVLFNDTDLVLSGVGNALRNTITGSASPDRLLGEGGNDVLAGGIGNDVLFGGPGADRLLGQTGNDRLIGGLGKDTLSGGGGADDFVFLSLAEAGLGASRDEILDFRLGLDDVVLSSIDANSTVAGDQAFTFIGSSAFSKTPGELRSLPGTFLADVNGDGRADMQVDIANGVALTAQDFVL